MTSSRFKFSTIILLVSTPLFFLFGANGKPTDVSDENWALIKPYLMPMDHPIRTKLDKLFSASRVLADSQSLERAGFKCKPPGTYSHAIIAAHKQFRGYIFKLFRDDQNVSSDWDQWYRRASGARFVKNSIKRHHFSKELVVPDKWIYPVPQEHAARTGSKPKKFLLVATKIPVLKRDANYYFWYHTMDHKRLTAIYTVIEELGLFDSRYAFNVPYAKDMRNAFIDLEHHHGWPIDYSPLYRWLRSSMQLHLHELILRNDVPHL